MPVAQPAAPASPTPFGLRLWPGVVAACLLVLVGYLLPAFLPDTFFVGVIAGLIGGIAIVSWWLLLSRAPWSERIGAVGVMVGSAFVMSRLVHVSIAHGMMGMMYPIYAIPTITLALVAWAMVGRNLSTGPRRDGGGHRHRKRHVDAASHGWHLWRLRLAAHVALDADGRRAAPGSGTGRG